MKSKQPQLPQNFELVHSVGLISFTPPSVIPILHHHLPSIKLLVVASREYARICQKPSARRATSWFFSFYLILAFNTPPFSRPSSASGNIYASHPRTSLSLSLSLSTESGYKFKTRFQAVLPSPPILHGRPPAPSSSDAGFPSQSYACSTGRRAVELMSAPATLTITRISDGPGQQVFTHSTGPTATTHTRSPANKHWPVRLLVVS